MFLAFGFAASLAASALTALLVVLVSRFLLGSSLTFWSAFKAALLVLSVVWLTLLALVFAGQVRLVNSPTVAVLLPLSGPALLVVFLAWMGKTVDGERIGLRQASIAAVLASLAGFAIGWAGWKAYLPSNPMTSRFGVSWQSGQGFELPAHSRVCLRNLALMLSDTGSGPKPGAAREYEQSLEKDAQSRGITVEEALKQDLRKLGAKPPTGCGHLTE